MKITFISNNVFPSSNASAVHQLNYMKGLANLGHNITILTTTKQKEAINIENIKVVDTGISSTQYFGIKKINNRIKSLQACQGELYKQKTKQAIDLLVILTVDYFSVSFFLKMSKKINIPTIHERGENPFIIKPNLPFAKFFIYRYLKYLIPQFNGIYLANNNLISFFKKYTHPNCKIKRISGVVDYNAFQVKQEAIYNFEYFAYCGTLYGTKDGVEIMISAFNSFSKKHPHVKLIIAGDNTDSKKMRRINALVENNCKNIIFTGHIGRNKIINILNNAKALLLARPDNTQAKYGFPSKLGEYLSTGNPIVITNTSDITDYLKDGHTAFIANPDSIESFCNKLIEMYNSEEKLIIGKRGKEIAKNNFSIEVQAEKISLFFKDVVKLYNNY